MSRRHRIICVDCAHKCEGEKWLPLFDGYYCKVVRSAEEALSVIVCDRGDALIATCAATLAKILMWLRPLESESLVVLLSENTDPCGADYGFSNDVDKVSTMAELCALLRQKLPAPGTCPFVPRVYPILDLSWPISVIANRDDGLVGYGGRTIGIGAGGMHGILDGPLEVGEKVLVTFLSDPDDYPHRAQVRYCYRDVYGLTFEEDIVRGRILDCDC